MKDKTGEIRKRKCHLKAPFCTKKILYALANFQNAIEAARNEKDDDGERDHVLSPGLLDRQFMDVSTTDLLMGRSRTQQAIIQEVNY